MDYENDMYIDEEALDIEWLEQAALALKYGRYWAKCQQELIRCEEHIKLVRAELIKKAHTDAEKIFDLPDGKTPTGPMVEAYYRNHKRHKEAKEDWMEAQFEANVAEVAKFEISRTRKAALENLVRLHGQNYFAGPAMPRNLMEEREQRAKKQREVNKDIGKGMVRRKK